MLLIQVLGSLVLVGCFHPDAAGHFAALLRLDMTRLAPGLVAWCSQAKPWQFALLALWNFVVWCWFAGPVLRTAAAEWTTGKRVTVKESADFGRRNFWEVLYTPFLPLACMAVFYAAIALGGFLCRLPYLGEVMAAVFLPFSILFAFPLVVFGVAFCFALPLAWAAIHVDGSDTRDAIARGAHYFYAGVWEYLGLSIVAFLYGLLFLAETVLGGSLVLCATVIAGWKGIGFLSAGSKFDPVANELWRQTVGVFLPSFTPWFIPESPISESTMLLRASAWGVQLVVYLYALLLLGSVVAYGLSAMQAIYLLLRHSVDKTPLDRIIGLEEKDPLALPETKPETETGATAPAEAKDSAATPTEGEP
jgi:hypothetical protein